MVSLKQNKDNHFLIQVHLEALQDLLAQDRCTNMLLSRKPGTPSMAKTNTRHQTTTCKFLAQPDMKLGNYQRGLKQDQYLDALSIPGRYPSRHHYLSKYLYKKPRRGKRNTNGSSQLALK